MKNKALLCLYAAIALGTFSATAMGANVTVQTSAPQTPSSTATTVRGNEVDETVQSPVGGVPSTEQVTVTRENGDQVTYTKPSAGSEESETGPHGLFTVTKDNEGLDGGGSVTATNNNTGQTKTLATKSAADSGQVTVTGPDKGTIVITETSAGNDSTNVATALTTANGGTASGSGTITVNSSTGASSYTH